MNAAVVAIVGLAKTALVLKLITMPALVVAALEVWASMSTTDTATPTRWQEHIVKYKTIDDDGYIGVVMKVENEHYVNIFSKYWRTIYNLRKQGKRHA